MKNILKSLAIISTIAFSVILFSHSAIAETGTGTTVATIVHNTMTIAETTPLSFGSFKVAATTAGTINESGIATGGVTKVTDGTSGAIGVSNGDANAFVNVTISATSILEDPDNDNDMTANLYLDSAHSVTTQPMTLTETGTQNVPTYGVLTVPAGHPANSYDGSFTLTVTYN